MNEKPDFVSNDWLASWLTTTTTTHTEKQQHGDEKKRNEMKMKM